MPILTALLLTILLLAILRPLAHPLGLVDRPDKRKQHAHEIPLVGGIAMALAFIATQLLFDPGGEGNRAALQGLLLAGLLITLVGAWDDHRDLPSGARFMLQIAAAGAFIWWGDTRLRDLGEIWFGDGPLGLGAMTVALTIFATVGMINALNMIDGVDGLAGSVALIGTIGLAGIALLAERPLESNLALALAATLAGFLLFNARLPGRRRALVFMGDAGSMFLGLALCWLSIRLSQGDQRAMAPVIALWLFALPLCDTVTLLIRRTLKGQSPFRADREHLHHLLLQAGFSHCATVRILAGIALICALIGIAGEWLKWPEHWMFVSFLALFVLHFLLTRHAWKVMRALRH